MTFPTAQEALEVRHLIPGHRAKHPPKKYSSKYLVLGSQVSFHTLFGQVQPTVRSEGGGVVTSQVRQYFVDIKCQWDGPLIVVGCVKRPLTRGFWIQEPARNGPITCLQAF